MLKQQLAEAMTYQQFLNQGTMQQREEALKRWDMIRLSTQNIEEIRSIKMSKIRAYMRLDCPDCMLLLPILDKIHQINREITYEIIAIEEEKELEKLESIVEIDHIEFKIPTLVFYKGEIPTGIFSGQSKDFMRRIKRLDEEDVAELRARYRCGKYNNQLIDEIIKLFK